MLPQKYAAWQAAHREALSREVETLIQNDPEHPDFLKEEIDRDEIHAAVDSEIRRSWRQAATSGFYLQRKASGAALTIGTVGYLFSASLLASTVSLGVGLIGGAAWLYYNWQARAPIGDRYATANNHLTLLRTNPNRLRHFALQHGLLV